MRQPRRLGILAAAVLALTLAACDEDNGARVVGPDGTEIEITALPTDAPGEGPATPAVPDATPTHATGTDATGTPTGSPEATVVTEETPAGSEPTPASEAATPTPTASPDGGGAGATGGLEGEPFSSAEVRAAIEDAGLTFQVDDERAPLCADTAVPATTFRAGDSGASTSVWSLWVYPDSDAREDDWELDDGQLIPQTDDCALPSGFNYFNANAVLAFVGWEGTAEGSAGDAPAREAFLEMAP